MLRISKLADYGIVVATALAETPGRLCAASDLAEQSGISAPTVSKLLKILAQHRIVQSVRGSHGGYRLTNPPEDTSLTRVLEALEGPLSLTECTVHEGQCTLESHCGVRGNWLVINRAVKKALDAVTLADLAEQRHIKPIDTSKLTENIIGTH